MDDKSGTKLEITTGSAWKLTSASAVRGARRSARKDSKLLNELAATRRVELKEEYQAELQPRRGVTEQSLTVELKAPDDAYVLAAHHESGAVTFHIPERVTLRRGAAARTSGATTLRFRVEVGESVRPGSVRRGAILRKIIRLVVIKLVEKVAGWALVKLAAKWETSRWKEHTRGLLAVDPKILALGSKGSLPLLTDKSRIAKAPQRNLLLIHGTFSKTESGFAGLATTAGTDGKKFFDAVRDIYGDRIFAFNHFTVSESPEENAAALLDALPNDGAIFDVITHSRGALVLRTLTERRAAFGAKANRFELGKAILCAGPNEGTPIADGDRWKTLTTWIANITDLFPDNPFTFAVDFLAEALNWLAQTATEKLPGLASMDPRGELIVDLQDNSNFRRGTYWAIAANFEPDENLLWRAADMGIDGFFDRANDMVVPTAGSWRVGLPTAGAINATQIACFGLGGNVRRNGKSDVHHCNLFTQPETIDSLVRVLRDQPLALPPLDPATEPPTSALFGRRGVPVPAPALISPQAGIVAKATAVETAALASSAPGDRLLPNVPRAQVVTMTDSFGRTSAFLAPIEPPADENFNLFLAAPPDANEDNQYYLLASFRNARVLVRFPTRDGDAGKRWQRIIAIRKHISGYIEGNPKFSTLPNEQDLRELGRDLFDTLFPGDIRRLYDHARAEFARPLGAQVAERRLNIIFTSMVGWVADKPWEFAYDPSRRTFLCVEDVNFVRNVLTAVPAEARLPRQDKLRILVVAAQPVGAAALSVDEEIAVIRRGFQPLIDAQLANVQIVPAVTPESLHELMETSTYGNDPIDVLHFIGHGEYSWKERKGYLLFENDRGGVQKIEAEIVRQIVARRGIRLVFLNACETGMGYSGPLDFSSGVAPSLVAAGVPAVVANQFSVLDPSATAFARHFYWSLAQGRSIGDAAREARVAVNYSITGEAIDWAVPVMFARNPFESLVVAPGATAPSTSAAAATNEIRRTRRSAGHGRRQRAAIWDVNHILPALEQVVKDMNAAQDSFFFEVADITAPIGTWRRVKTPKKDNPDEQASMPGDKKLNEGCLRSNEVFEKLHDVPARLGVNQLFCVTNFWLSDGTTDDLFGVQAPDHSISILSTAGLLDELNPPATTLERLVVNQIAGWLRTAKIHETGSKNCPMYYNNERDIRWIAGPLKLCPACRRELKRKTDGKTISAIDALLKLY